MTGAANGIGRATALAFAREGANVVVADISEQGNQETARMIEELGKRVLTVTCDVAQAKDVKAALDKTIETFGRLDFAFNNAGVVRSMVGRNGLYAISWKFYAWSLPKKGLTFVLRQFTLPQLTLSCWI
ncbi:SDR family oxidoreductase [Nostoc sp.]|uniref:SDR family oxidoreductase n=1 Tax=Nostoc sp. TaxID=1180 RepID=UPI002FFB71E7